MRLVRALWSGQVAEIPDLLTAWVPEATEAITAKVLSPTLPEMQRVALERKREQGSETMFIAGLITHVDRQAHLFWMGDMRVALWGSDGAEIPLPGAVFETRERWSSRIGPKNGGVRMATIALDGVAHLTAHSDGVGSFAPRLRAISQDLLNSIVAEQNRSAASDDISVLDIELAYQPVFGPFTTLRAPTPRQPTLREPVITWRHVPLATRYRVSVEDGDRSFTQEVDATIRVDRQFSTEFTFFVPVEEDRPVTCRVQALNDYTFPSPWSTPLLIQRLTDNADPLLEAEADTRPIPTPNGTGAPLPEADRRRERGTRQKQKKSRLIATLTIVISAVLLVGVIVAAWVALIILNWLNWPN